MNGVWDAGEGERFVLTDANGEYALDNLLPGDYTVAQVAPANWTPTFPAAGNYPITLAAGATSSNNDFGNESSPIAETVEAAYLSGLRAAGEARKLLGV